jgi:hypothetical protein
MNAEQKRAWFVVALTMVCAAGYLILLPLVGPTAAMGIFGLFGLGFLAPLIGLREKTDERDRSIARLAAIVGAMTSYGAFFVGCFGSWVVVYAVQGREQVSVHLLASITGIGGIALFFARSVAVLILYGRHVENDNA